MESLPIDRGGLPIMVPKGEFFIFKTTNISSTAANVLKQQMLSIGGECAVSKFVATCSVKESPVILMGTRRHFLRLIESLKNQYFGLGKFREELIEFFEDIKENKVFRVAEKEFDLSKKTIIMGILNVTPDSFSDGGRYLNVNRAIEAALQMEQEGADIIDIGGESTRPGADPISIETEQSRVMPVIEGIQKHSKISLSIDTVKSKVAEEALKNGVSLVNDISGLNFDEEMANIVSKHRASVVLMHIKGNPKNMQENPKYENLVDEILYSLSSSVERALNVGIEKDKILIDPGIGFGKEWKDNYIILRYLKEFKSLGFPILVGPSRKSFIGNLLDLPVQERVEGSLAAVCCAIMNGANIIRVHDVKETVRAAKVADAIVGRV
ncbi:MAG: dihydropteroate synthase [Candidatus Neomarinimicrobiota bacterium]|nr:MAG: dihydropteroate synthase [Candidatus Neomarinimicrobiota bacterium]